MSKVRTRFAPSPTGRMHVGNLRTALYAYLVAKHEGGDFILRIEDTDQERYVEGAVDIIYRTLQKTGLIHDEGPDKDGGCGPYVQSERQAQGIYLKYAKELIDKGEAYYCFCDKERLEGLKKVVAGKEIHVYDKHCLHLSKEEVEEKLAAGVPYVIRQNNPTEGTTTFEDEIYGDITVDNAELDDMILIKSDGYPTYNFANVIDDHLMNITHVVRGNEYLSHFFKHRILGNLILPFLLVWIVNRIVSGNISMSLLDELIELLMHGETTLPYSWYVFSILLFYILFYMIAAKRNVVIISFLCVFTYIVLTVSLSYERCWYISALAFPLGIFYCKYEKRICALWNCLLYTSPSPRD